MKKAYLFLLFVLGCMTYSTAQVSVKGTVVSKADQMPIPGAYIVLKGNGGQEVTTVTDFDGEFVIESKQETGVVEISSLGYEPQIVNYKGNQTLAIVLQDLTSMLDEVVIVGYGSQKKSDVTGSIASVKSENFNKGVVTNPGQLLQGKVAGVNISNVSGEPGAAQDVVIRGVGSLRSGTTPLYVVDGFALDNSGTGVASNPLNFINPQDIESIDVLKDASAAAIYGARGANGVIVITTKKGKSGKAQMNATFSTAIANMASKIAVFDADEFRKQVVAEDGTLNDFGGNTNWQDELTGTAISNNANFSMNGATDKFSYYTSLGVNDQEGILNGSELKTYSGRVNISQKAIDDRFNVAINLTGTRTENTRPNAQAMVSDMLQLNPTIPVYTNGEPTLLDGMLNPMTREKLYSDEAINNRMLANISPSFEIVKGLTYKMNLGVDYSSTERDVQFIPYTLLEGYAEGSLTSTYTTNKNTLIENTITYNLKKDKHNATFLVGHSFQETYAAQKSFNLTGFSDNGIEPKYQDQVSGENTATTMSTYAVKNELQSFFGRANYAYNNKYLVTATMRADGSSKFGENNKYGYFPSVALGWNIIKEDFLKDVNFVNNLKLRASWGQTGNQEIPSKITKLSYTDSRTDNDTYPINGTENSLDDYPYGTIYTRLANPDIQWEVSTQTNVGLDFGFFNNRLTGTFDVFSKTSENVLLEVTPADPIQPTAKYWTNVPDMEIKNKGVEFALDYKSDYTKDFTYNIGGNIAYTKNEVANSPYKVLTTGAAQGAGQTGATINGNLNGESIGSFYMKEFLGIGDDGLSLYSDESIVAGSALPNVVYAFYINLNYKRFDLGLNFNGVSGNKIYNHVAMSLYNKGKLTSSFNTTDFAVQYPNEDYTNSNNVSTRYLEDGSFLRLNNATLGYSLDAKKLGFDKWIQDIRLSVTGQNLFVLTDYSGFDPEINSSLSTDGIQTFGIDYFSYPKSRTIVFGLNVSF